MIAGLDIDAKRQFIAQMSKAVEQVKLEVLLKSFSEIAESVAMNHSSWNGEYDERGQALLDGLTKVMTDYDPRCAVDYLLDINLEECASDDVVILVDDWRLQVEAEAVSEDDTLELVKVMVAAAPERIGDLPTDWAAGYYDLVVAPEKIAQAVGEVAQKYFVTK